MRIWQRSEHVVKRKIGGETLLVPMTGKLAELDRIYIIEGIGEFVWDALERRSEQHIVEDVACRYDVERTVAERDVSDFLRKLKEYGMAVCEETSSSNDKGRGGS